MTALLRYHRLMLFITLFLPSCMQDTGVNVPEFSGTGLPAGAVPMTAQHLQSMEGVYTVLEGFDQLGKQVVVKRTGKTLSMFTGKNAGLFVLRGGHIDSSIFLQGYWRFTQGSETGLVQWSIPAESFGTHILRGTPLNSAVSINGLMGEGTSVPGTPVKIQYERPLTDSTFAILAHRGGGRNSDRLPASENSVGLIKIAEQFGSTGIEIDVRMTKDHVPVLFHDENFSPRLVNTEYCVGPVSNFTFAAIRTLCTLKNGEPIPTLREALDAVVYETSLTVVWLDIKSLTALAPAAMLQSEYHLKAAAAGRSLEIYLGLATEELVMQYKKDRLTTPALCELSPDHVREVDARIWAPRWTLGPQPVESDRMREEGRRTFVWTLDQKDFILPFITGGKIDGILTNYPALVAFEFYALQ